MRFLYRRTDRHACNPARIRTKINYKVSITLYVVVVKFINTIYRYLGWRNTIYCDTLKIMYRVSCIETRAGMSLFCGILIFCFRRILRQTGIIAEKQVCGKGSIQIFIPKGRLGGFPEIKTVISARLYLHLFPQKQDDGGSLTVSEFYFVISAQRLR